VPEAKAYSYAVVRVVPRVERDEFINAGVMLFCPELRFLEAFVRLNEHRMIALWPEVDLSVIRRHLAAIPRICAGGPEAGPIAMLSQKERFYWLSAPRSTMIQISPVRIGITRAPRQTLTQLANDLIS
jgi:hypothetical protein